jgi:hypothetical protein
MKFLLTNPMAHPAHSSAHNFLICSFGTQAYSPGQISETCETTNKLIYIQLISRCWTYSLVLVSVGKPEENIQIGGPNESGWGDNIKIDSKERVCEDFELYGTRYGAVRRLL